MEALLKTDINTHCHKQKYNQAPYFAESQQPGLTEIPEIGVKQEQEDNQKFIYLSNHDQQEPLHKILVFSVQVLEIESVDLSENGVNYLKRINNAAKNMQSQFFARSTGRHFPLLYDKDHYRW